MRNLKKILSLALALVMTLSVMSFASAASNNFGDSDEINADYAEAVDVLNGLKVFVGDTNNDFNPKDNISRAEAAAVIYRIATQDVTNAQIGMYATSNYFSDVTPDNWFAGYVNYCANATYIKGTGEDLFDPYGNVTGYQVLAMILRVAGYDANGEFTGVDWQIKVASTAKELGIIDTVSDVRLDQAVTREVVAELLFQTLEKVNKVRYTNAFGYVTEFGNGYNYDNLGDYLFGLDKTTVLNLDEWGRPGYRWTATKPAAVKGTIAEYALTPVYTSTVKNDECDIAKTIGLTKDAQIEKGYIDCEEQAVDNNGKIEVLGTTVYMGAQGRVTEIYDLSQANLKDEDGKAITGYRVVEINTYLGVVTKTTEAYTDKNNHPVAATATVKVYLDLADSGDAYDAEKAYTDTVTLTTDKYAVGDYLLVDGKVTTTTNDDGDVNGMKITVKDHQAATIVAGGVLNGWTNGKGEDPNTSTVGTTEYKDSDKFVLNWRSAEDSSWAVAKDTYGNIIGLVPAVSNYLVVEKIEWKHSTDKIGEGVAKANIVLSDGTSLSNVVVSYVNGVPVTDTGDTTGNVDKATVSDYYTNNGDYYGHIYTYSVNADGTYTLVAHAEDSTNPADVESVEITQGQASINVANVNKYVANSTTVFLLKGANEYTYTKYVGRDNVPSGKGTICVLTDDNGYATLVVSADYKLAGNTFIAFVTDDDADVTKNPLGTGYKVFKQGETTSTTIYDYTTTAAYDKLEEDEPDDGSDYQGNYAAFAFDKAGLYKIEVNTKGQIVSMSEQVDLQDLDAESETTDPTNFADFDDSFVRVMVKAKDKNTSIQVAAYGSGEANNDKDNDLGYTVTAGDAFIDLKLTSDTKVIKVTKDAFDSTDATLSAGKLSDVITGSVVLVAYSTSGKTGYEKYTADTIYVIYVTKSASNNTPSTGISATLTFALPATGVTVSHDKTVYVDTNTETVTTTDWEFVVTTGTTAPTVVVTKTNDSSDVTSTYLKNITDDNSTGTGNYTYKLTGLKDGDGLTITVNGGSTAQGG
jgi:hypothetical protein